MLQTAANPTRAALALAHLFVATLANIGRCHGGSHLFVWRASKNQSSRVEFFEKTAHVFLIVVVCNPHQRCRVDKLDIANHPLEQPEVAAARRLTGPKLAQAFVQPQSLKRRAVRVSPRKGAKTSNGGGKACAAP